MLVARHKTEVVSRKAEVVFFPALPRSRAIAPPPGLHTSLKHSEGKKIEPSPRQAARNARAIAVHKPAMSAGINKPAALV